MWTWMNETLVDFRICFSRKAAFKWFVVIVISMMAGTEHSGVTSVIRELSLSSRCYESILNFFHASSWKIETLRDTWISLVKKNVPILEVEGYHILAGDVEEFMGIKKTKATTLLKTLLENKLIYKTGSSRNVKYVIYNSR